MDDKIVLAVKDETNRTVNNMSKFVDSIGIAKETVDALEEINAEIVGLSLGNLSGHALFARAAELINRLSIVIENAEQSGLTKEEILEKITGARSVFGKSNYVNRMQNWPRGYQGDFETVEMIYQGAPANQLETLGECIDYYAQTLPISQQHRNKLVFQQDLAMQCLRLNQNVMSIGCGGAIDIANALKVFPEYSGSLCFIDMDADAISLTRERTESFNCTYTTKNIIRGIGSEKNGHYDLILCGGLFDYLNDSVSQVLLKQISKKLTRPGKLFLSNIARNNPFRIQMEYFGNWVLLERSESELVSLIKGSVGDNVEVKVQRDFTGLAILTVVDFE